MSAPPSSRSSTVKRRLPTIQWRSRPALVAALLAIELGVAVADYFTGLEYSIDVFYLIPIALAVWFLGRSPGVAFAVASAAASFAMNGLPKVAGSRLPVVSWNAAILLVFFLVVVWILSHVRRLHRQLEQRVQERTAALCTEIVERERLEKALLSVSEAERQRIGHDLHDSLGQQLTAAALACKALMERSSDAATTARAAGAALALVEDCIDLARRLARGLAPVQVTTAGLMEAFEEFADTASECLGVDCRFVCNVPVLIPDPTTATHLYRIAQEAINNAVKHGNAKRIVVQLAKTEAGTVLEIADDGVGLPEPLPTGHGMGLRVMAHRATMIGATFTIRRATTGGTVVTCTVP